MEEIAIKPKRGRRSKKDILAAAALALSLTENIVINPNNELNNEEKDEENTTNEIIDIKEDDEQNNLEIKQVAKKRGRKPKGGKIIPFQTLDVIQKENRPNVILHLKCSLKDINVSGEYNSNFVNTKIESFNFNASKNELNYEVIDNDNDINELTCEPCSNSSLIKENNEIDNYESKDIWKKLKILEHNLHVNNISDKKSACFWCSYDFDNPPIYIPKHYINNSYHVYGCFCTPECAVAHLMEENIDSSTKFESYHLMNHIYSKIYEYKKNIKPAPNPYYMLDRFYGNLTIQEYRSLLKSERLFLIVDKPLTRILPEFHEDNDDFIINSKIIPSNNYQLKKRQQKKPQTKNNILNEKFGISNQT